MSGIVTIVDYGMGNLCSVASAIKYLGVNCQISSDPEVVADAKTIILPGVGSFRNAIKALREHSLDKALSEAVNVRRTKILGICLGMQLLAEHSTEDGGGEGLGFIAGKIERFRREEIGGLKIPHMGFNQVCPPNDSLLFEGLPKAPDFYFAHSYRLKNNPCGAKVTKSKYGIEFVAAYECENVYATQFHPEKSQTNGLRLIHNFLLA